MNNKDIINKSGFPLQIAIENLIGHNKRPSDWRVLHSEHSWKLNNESGFIDLILELDGGILVLVVECKRVLNSSWYFLNSEGKFNDRKHSKAWVSQYGNDKPKQFNWIDIPLAPSSPECEYCTILGQDSKSKPMLERVAATLVNSTEAYAREDIYNINEGADLKVYFNVIITTAKLEVCSFAPEKISISDGTLNECNFKEVPYLRFRKQLQNDFDPKALKSLNEHEISRAKENSVFIVNSEHINQFLKGIDLGNNYTLRK